MMNQPQIFTLGRIIDKNFLTNKLIVGITFIALIIGILVYIYQEFTLFDSLIFGFILALTTFFCWAVAREIFPQSDYAAIVAAIASIIGLLYFQINPMIILILLWLTMVLRLINQTTGLKPSTVDRGLILIFSLISSYIFSWILLIFLTIAFFVNYLFSKEKSDIIFMIISFVAAFVFIFYQGIWHNQESLYLVNGLFIGFLLIVFIVMMWLVRNVRIVGDNSSEKVPIGRIFSGQLISVIAGGGFVLRFGNESIYLLIPLWTVFLCSIIFAPLKLFQYRKSC